MRATAFLLPLALIGATTLDALPREEFLRIDEPIWLGFEKITARLQSVRASRPLVAIHLSGGSARGLAHLGVLERLEEAGIRPDLIITTSMGSAVGLLYAAGVPPDVIADIFLTVDFAELFTAKLPVAGGIADLRGLLALTRELVGEVNVADLPTPTIAVCEDLRSMRRVLLAEGELGTVLQAAITIPGLFDPVGWGNMTLIDGGVGSIAAMKPFRQMADVHISSTAFYDRQLEPDDPFTAVTMAINIAKSRPAVEDINTLQPFLIRNDVEQFPYMGWHQLREIFRRGYDACSRRLPELQRQLAQRGSGLPAPQPPERARRAAELRARWTAIKRRMSAGQRIPLDRGYGAFQAHPVLLRLYRAPNRLEQHNYAALSYLYEGARGGIRVGALSDAAARHGAFLDLYAASHSGLTVSLRSIVRAGDPDELPADATLYHLFRSDWPLPLADRLALGPFIQGELLQESAAQQTAAAAGLRATLTGRTGSACVGGELAVFLETEEIFGPAIEVFFRRRIAGSLHALARGLYRQSLSATDALTPSYNDFFRGSLPDSGMGSYAVINSQLILAPDRFLTIWEAFIIRSFQLSLFCDALWEEAARHSRRLHPSVGASLQAEAALGGLLPTTVMLSLGYDLDQEDVVFTVNLGAPY